MEANEHQGYKPFHILAISGGGFRGLYAATVLEELEASLGAPLASRFDLICGTSVGGLLALGLALEMPASELAEIFTKHGKDIFNSRGLIRRLTGFWLQASHSNEGLRGVLAKRFSDQLIGHVKHPVIIPTVNFSTGKAQLFKTPHHKSFETDHRMTIVDAALATSAAPVYLPIAKNERGNFVDGGLVGNAPGLFGLHEARQFFGCNAEDVRLLSIGTMTIGNTIRGNRFRDRGFLLWRAKLFDLIISAQESAVDYMLKHELKDRYFRIDDIPSPDQTRDIKKLDKVSKAAIETLQVRGRHAAQCALGNVLFEPFRHHTPAPARFFHGPNKNIEE